MAFLRSKNRNVTKAAETSKTGISSEADVARLAGKAASGDVKAFGTLYDIYLNSIYRYVYYHVKDKMAAEDLTQEIFMKAWGAIGKYEWQGRPFSAWLFRIARNHTIDFYRSTRRYAKLEEETSADIGDPQREAEKKLIEDELLSAVSCLPPQQKELILLKFFLGLDNQHIGLIMAKSQVSIRVMQMRALSALQQKLSVGIEK